MRSLGQEDGRRGELDGEVMVVLDGGRGKAEIRRAASRPAWGNGSEQHARLLGSFRCEEKDRGSPEKEYFASMWRNVRSPVFVKTSSIRALCCEGEEEDGGRSFTTC